MRATGSYGELRHGYQVAMELGQWTIDLARKEPRLFVLSAAVVREQMYWASQRPLDLVLALGMVEWIWRDIMVVRDDDNRIVVELRERPVVADRATRGV